MEGVLGIEGVSMYSFCSCFFFFQAEDGIRDGTVTGVQTCALPIWPSRGATPRPTRRASAMRSTEVARPAFPEAGCGATKGMGTTGRGVQGMNGNGSRRTVRTALGAALVTVALALIPSAALGVAPQLDSVNLPVGQNHPTFQWTLPMGDKGRVWSDHLVVSTSSEQYAPGTYLAGEFLDRYWASFNTLQKND